MSLLTDAHDSIQQARQMAGPPWTPPCHSFAEFFSTRVHHPAVSDRPFLTYYDDDRDIHRSYTYGQFGRMVELAATFLHHRLGLTSGDRIVTVLFNHDQTVALYFAAWTLGIAVVPINVEEPADKKRYILEHSEAVAVCCWPDYLEEVRSLQQDLPTLHHVITVTDEGLSEEKGQGSEDREEPMSVPSCRSPHGSDLDDEALIVYTSGTTGPPKGVILSVYNLLVDADGIATWHSLGPEDRLMCVLPIHHVNGTVVTLVTPFYCKGSVVLNRKFKTAAFWRLLHHEQITLVSVVPTLLEFLLDANEDMTSYALDRLGGCICGAGPLLKDTAARFEERFHVPIRHGYGLSETTCYSCFLPNDLSTDEHRHWLTEYECPSIGVPLPHNEMAILNEDGKPLAAMARGEICIRGRTVCAGYFKRDDANDAAFNWGWFRSGDEGFYTYDDHGRPFFFISGRLKELIIRGGVNISPLEIDDLLKRHPGVKFAMTVPFENRYYGEEIAAYVVPRNGEASLTSADVLDFCRLRLPFSKRPKVILFGEEVPYTSTGKPKRLELKSRLVPLLAAYREHQFKEGG
ncbi:class I adenylate-forming enzyme family protein [Nitrospira sp. Nam74]